MSDFYPNEPLEGMSDGALRKAIQSLENAKGSVEYAIRMIPDDPNYDDITSTDGPAKDAKHRIEQQLGNLYHELERREDE